MQKDRGEAGCGLGRFLLGVNNFLWVWERFYCNTMLIHTKHRSLSCGAELTAKKIKICWERGWGGGLLGKETCWRGATLTARDQPAASRP